MLFKLTNAIADQLRGVFTPYFKPLANLMVGHLGGTRASVSGKRKRRATSALAEYDGPDGPFLRLQASPALKPKPSHGLLWGALNWLSPSNHQNPGLTCHRLACWRVSDSFPAFVELCYNCVPHCTSDVDGVSLSNGMSCTTHQ